MNIAILASVLALFAHAAQAQVPQGLIDRLERLEREIDTLNKIISRGSGAIRRSIPTSSGVQESLSDSGISRLTLRINALEQDLRVATGSLEQFNFGIQQLTNRLDKLVDDIDYRLASIEEKMNKSSSDGSSGLRSSGEQGAGANPSISNRAGAEKINRLKRSKGLVTEESAQPPQILGTVSSSAVEEVEKQSKQQLATTTPILSKNVVPKSKSRPILPAGKPKDQYTFALNLLRQTKYKDAEQALAQFIATRAEHPLAGNARYWLGETYYVQKDYEQAAQTFFNGYRVSPSNVKAPDMLLKLGMSLFQIKKPKEACATFDKLAHDFPNAPARIKSAVVREKKRLRC